MNEQQSTWYIPIFLDSLMIDTVIDFNLFIYNRADASYLLYRASNTAFLESHRQRLIENKVPALFISSTESAQYHAYIEKNMRALIESPGLSSDEKASVIYQTARTVMEEMMTKPMTGDSVKRSQRFITNTVRYVIQEKDYFFNLIHLTSHDYFTYTHSINVSIYTLSLARNAGVADEDMLQAIGTGALLHDIGKRSIPQTILLKKGPLSDVEWGVMKEHPDRGVVLLQQDDAVHNDIADIVRYHHEKIDGSGYPLGLKGNEIPYYARMTTIADIFDALNTNRPYKRAADTYHSLEIMNDQFMGKIDRDLFKMFVLLFKK